MGTLARLLDGVSVTELGTLLALVWLVVRVEWTRSENAAAHEGITKNIDGVKKDLDDVRQDVKRLLTGEVAWMRAFLQAREPRE